MQLFNDLQLRKSIVAEKMAEASIIQAEASKVQAEADKERAIAEKERTRVEKLAKYLQLLDKDTSGYSEALKARHEQVLDYLARELISSDN